MKGKDDILVKTSPLRDLINTPWERFLTSDVQQLEIEEFRKHERTGRPMGKDFFIKKMESLLDRKLKPRKPGPKKR